MQRTIVPGLSMWSVWQRDRNLFFNSFFIETSEGNLAVDPLPLAATDRAEIETRGGVAWIVVTNRDHERDARALATATGAKIATSVAEAPLLSERYGARTLEIDSYTGAEKVGFRIAEIGPGQIASNDLADVCYDPDSHKLAVEKSGVLVRDNPQLSYWDGQ